MILEKLILQDFKNHSQLELKLNKTINLIVGKNGVGKTNILDAIHFLSMSKSAFQTQDSLCIKHGSVSFALQGWISMTNGEQNQIFCSQASGQKKVFKVNKKSYPKIYEHIGRFPVVLISPFDNDLVREGSETRRRFFDTMISQIDQGYLQKLISYNHYLKQRNSILKQWAKGENTDRQLLEIYDEHLIELAIEIAQIRNNFISDFSPIFKNLYKKLSHETETPQLSYQTKALDSDYEFQFKNSFNKDLVLERTNTGIHKDEFEFQLENNSLKSFGSQGQQKSFVIALKLANFEIIKQKKNFPPFLLLDDIFEKLDEQRIKQLIAIVTELGFGQIFITDARIETSNKFFENTANKMTIFDINTI